MKAEEKTRMLDSEMERMREESESGKRMLTGVMAAVLVLGYFLWFWWEATK